jgi:hypothetical protein
MAKPGRIYLQLDVNYCDDPDVVELSDLAQLLDIRAMSLSKRTRSEGRLTRRQLEKIAPGDPAEVIAELTASPLWSEEGGIFERRSWTDWNEPSKDTQAKADGGTFGAHLRWHVQRGINKADCSHCVLDGSMGTHSDTHIGSQSDSQCKSREEERREESNTLSRGSSPRISLDTDRCVTSPPARRVQVTVADLERDFGEAWRLYPRKEGRKAALGAYIARRRAGESLEDLLVATQLFALAMEDERRGREHIMLGSRFFGPNEEWRDYLHDVDDEDEQ